MTEVAVYAPAEAWEDARPGVEALLEAWLIDEGAEVVAGQPIASIVVVKTTFEVVAPVSGCVTAFTVAKGGTFPVAQQIALIAPVDAAATGAVATETVARAASNGTATLPFAGLRRAVAESMTAAWTAPQVAIATEVDMSSCVERLRALGTENGASTRVGYTHLILRAVALTLPEHPRLNGRVDAEGVQLDPEVNVGLAVALEDGVVVPVIPSTGTKSLPELAAEVEEATALCRGGAPPAAMLRGGTFTVSTLGAIGIDWFTPILNAPEIAILGVGRVAKRPVVKDDVVVVAPTATLVLVFDHRALDGVPAAAFLAALRERLEDAASL